MKSKPNIKLLFILITIWLNPKCQTPYYINYTTDNGLISDYVYCVFQDSKNNIWCGTNEGVSSFNGESFTNYTTKNGLSDNEVLRIFEDKNGRIWFFCFNGKVCFFYNNKLYNEENTSWLRSLNSNFRMLDYYIGDNIYLINSKTCYVIDSSNNVKEIFKSENDSTYFLSLVELNKSPHLYSSNKIINIIQPNISYNTPEKYNFHSKLYHSGKNENLIITNVDEIFTLNSNFQKKYSKNITYGIQGISIINNDYFIGTTKGLIQTNSTNKKYLELFHEISVTNIIKDSEGGTWFGSTNKGIFYIPNFNITDDNKVNINELFKKIETLDSKVILFNNKGGIIELQNNILKQIFNLKDNQNADFYSIKNITKNIYTFCSQGLINYNIKSNEFKPFVTEISIKDFHTLKDSIYLATSSGIFKTSKQEFYANNRTIFHNKKYKKISSEYTRFLIPINNAIYACTSNGLKEIINDSIYQFDSKYQLFNNQIVDYKFDHLNNIYFASNGFGIAKYNTKTKEITSYNNTDIENCKVLRIDNQNKVWALSTRGLFKLNNELNKFDEYLDIHSFFNTKILDFIIYNDTIIAISKNRIFKLPTNLVFKTTEPKTVSINSVLYNDKLQYGNIINVKRELENILRFNYSCVTYTNKKRLKFKYQLIGFDKTENFTDLNEIRYTNLPAGNYKFTICACIKHGNNFICGDSKIISISISEMWYKSLWFKLIIISLLVLISFIIAILYYNNFKTKQKLINTRIKNEKNKAVMDKNLTQLEQKALLAQMNPHFIFNALNTIHGFY